MKKTKKLINLVVAAVMALGIVIAPVAASAQNTPSVTKTSYGIFAINNKAKTTLTLNGLTAKGKKKTSMTILAKYKLAKVYKGAKYSTSGTYTVNKIKAGAFKGSKAKTIVIKGNVKASNAKNMLKSTKAKKVTIKVKKSLVKQWKKAAKAGKLGISGSRITIKKI